MSYHSDVEDEAYEKHRLDREKAEALLLALNGKSKLHVIRELRDIHETLKNVEEKVIGGAAIDSLRQARLRLYKLFQP